METSKPVLEEKGRNHGSILRFHVSLPGVITCKYYAYTINQCYLAGSQMVRSLFLTLHSCALKPKQPHLGDLWYSLVL